MSGTQKHQQDDKKNYFVSKYVSLSACYLLKWLSSTFIGVHSMDSIPYKPSVGFARISDFALGKYVKCELLGNPAARKVFDQHMEKSKLQDGRPCYKCNICGKENPHISHLRNHIESVHFPGHFSYKCDHCEKTFKSKNALCVHVSQMHKY